MAKKLKLKTNKSVAKRFKVTKRGKVLYKRANLRHLLSCKPRKRKRHARKMGQLFGTDRKTVRRLLPYV